MIFTELKSYATARLGPSGWAHLHGKANLPTKIYLVSQSYPDEEILALMVAASQITGLPVKAVLKDFGQYIVPGLLKLYGHLAKPEWRTLDLVEHTEAHIHTVVRRRNPGALPPMLKTKRLSPTQLLIDYSSPRKMCHLAKGIIKGVAQHYREMIKIRETACMLSGDERCLLKVSYPEKP